MSDVMPRVWKENFPAADLKRRISAVLPRGYGEERAAGWLRDWGIPLSADGTGLSIILCDKDFGYIPETGEYSDEKYSLEFSPEENRCVIKCSGLRGLHWGVNTLAKLIRKGALANVRIEDRPLFAARGFIEGFYGRPWSCAERAGMLRLASKYNMNTYYYGPKDDIYHRDRWNAPYDEASLRALGETVKVCADCGIDFYYCIGPGITIEYSDPGHLKALMDKIRQVYSLGVRRFSLFLDDIPEQLQYESDRRRYGDLAQAHISLIGRFYDECMRLDGDVKISVCPYLYCGTGAEAYISALGGNIPRDILLLWTGRDICSREITAVQAEEFRRHTGRMPAYWDNYPVNDANMYNEMHIGPILGRDKELYLHSRSYIANGMEYCEASKIAFLTTADYLWNPPAYDPREAWDDALRQVVGERDMKDFVYFADNLLTSCLRCQNSKIMAEHLHAARFQLKTGRREEARQTLAAYTEKMKKCEEMFRRGMENKKLQAELSRWIDKFYLCCGILSLCGEFLASGKPELKDRIRDETRRYLADGTVFADFCFQEFTDMLTESG